MRALACVVILAFAVPAAAQTSGKAADRLYVMDCGHNAASDQARWSPGVNVGKPIELSDSCTLIKHGNQWLLWDTGYPDAIADKPVTGPLGTATRARKLAAQLAELGVKPDDIANLTDRATQYEWPAAVGAIFHEALHAATDEMGRRASFKGYGPEQGYLWLREAIAQHDFQARGCQISAEEIFVSDGSKCDSANILDILGEGNRIAVTDPYGKGMRFLTDSWQDEAPTWSPNGRIVQFFRTERGSGKTGIWQVDLTGRNERKLNTPVDGSDPAWGPVLP